MTYSAITRGPTVHHQLVWITAKNRTTGLPETVGFWTGGEDRAFTIGGQARSYFGVGHIIQVPPILARAGSVIQSQEVKLSATSPEIEAALRGYDPRFAPIEIHTARFNPETMALLGIDRVFKGEINKAPRRTPAKNQTGAEWTLTIVSRARSLTKTLNLKKSDASQRARLRTNNEPDGWFKYADQAGQVERFWGMEAVR